jgi:hypothetical protein
MCHKQRGTSKKNLGPLARSFPEKPRKMCFWRCNRFLGSQEGYGCNSLTRCCGTMSPRSPESLKKIKFTDSENLAKKCHFRRSYSYHWIAKGLSTESVIRMELLHTLRVRSRFRFRSSVARPLWNRSKNDGLSSKLMRVKPVSHFQR